MSASVSRRRTALLRQLRRAAVPFALAASCGCASWSDLTSNSFWDAPAENLFHRPDPVAVLRNPDSTGDQIAKALHRLDEPRAHGGTPQGQEEVMQILARVATTDDRALCRLAAVEALGRFEDPRAGDILLSAYHSAAPSGVAETAGEGDGALRLTKLSGEQDVLEPAMALFPDGDTGTFPPEVVTALRCRAVEAMGRARCEAALPLLAELASGDAEGSRELRLAAVRSLGNYPPDPRVTGPLSRLARDESDVALRDRAWEGLVRVTGRDDPTPVSATPPPAGDPRLALPPPSDDLRQAGGWDSRR